MASKKQRKKEIASTYMYKGRTLVARLILSPGHCYLKTDCKQISKFANERYLCRVIAPRTCFAH